VKTYFQSVATRIAKAFRLEDFEPEDEIDFWMHAAGYNAQENTPSFIEIVSWIDRLYHAPVHFVYRKSSEDTLVLFKRHLIPNNIARLLESEKESSPKSRKKLMGRVQQQLHNLENKISTQKKFREVGVSGFTIGQCEHIPLFDGNKFWGIYCIGPYMQSPENMMPKLKKAG